MASAIDKWVEEEIKRRKNEGGEILDEGALREQLKKEFLDPSNWVFEEPQAQVLFATDFATESEQIDWWKDFEV